MYVRSLALSQGISLLAPEAAARVTHLTLHVPSPLPLMEQIGQYTATAALIKRAVDACPGLQTLEIDGTASWDRMRSCIPSRAWQWHDDPQLTSYMIEIFPRVAANARQPGQAGMVVGQFLLTVAGRFFDLMSLTPDTLVEGDAQPPAGAAAAGQAHPQRQVTMTNVPGRLAQHLDFVRDGLTELQVKDASVLRTWAYKASSLQLLEDLDCQHHNPSWSSTLHELMPVFDLLLAKDLRQQGFHTLRSLEVGSTLDYLQFSALSSLPCLDTVKVRV
jgi:hypothetical protein